MLASLVLFLIRHFPWLSADYRQRRINPRQMCPACGAIKKHKMSFDARQSLLILQCVVCTAAWGYNSVVKPQKWCKPLTEE